MITTKILSPLEKCFLDQTPDDFPALTNLRMFRNERASIQFAAYDPDEAEHAVHLLTVAVRGELAPYAILHTVEQIANYCPAWGTPKAIEKADPTFLRTTPGLYPDVLAKPMRGNRMPLINQQLHTAWIDFEGDIRPGVYPTTVALEADDGSTLSESTVEIEVLALDLPEQTTRVTNWFYADCLADYYQVEPFSDRHFEICAHFIETAVKNGINMILTPVFTVALDTRIGGERTTTQLVRIKREQGDYTFDFDLLDRWIAICERAGVQYFEISHLFSQWGAAHAPKVMATVDGEYRRLFGWETDASGEEYVRFLQAFLRELTAHLEQKGLKDRCYFHISDEPGGSAMEQYQKNRETVDPYLKDWKLLDALSDVEFYRQGLCPIPVPSSGAIEAFQKENIAERWVYYCCGPWVGASNRFVAMHLGRTRSIGLQMYRYGIEGFLHWGYNFYNNQYSYDHVNPFLNPAAGYWGVTGDAMVVYPGQDGYPLESLRLRAQKQALDDIRVLQLAERFCGREVVVSELEQLTGPVDFTHCINDSTIFHLLRDRMIDLILAAQ